MSGLLNKRLEQRPPDVAGWGLGATWYFFGAPFGRIWEFVVASFCVSKWTVRVTLGLAAGVVFGVRSLMTIFEYTLATSNSNV